MPGRPFVSLMVPFLICQLLFILPAGNIPARADYAQEVFNDRPVAWWRFQDSACTDGAAAKDATDRHPGVYRGGVTLEAGPAAIGGRAARFDGRRAYIDVPHQKDLAISELSVEAWVKSKQPWRAKQWPGSATLITKATSGPGSSDWTINAGAVQNGENEGRIIASIGATGSKEDMNLGSGQGLNDGQWHHVVWTRTADGFNRLYVDGRLADHAEDEGGPIANDRPIQIGGDSHQGGTFLDGALAEAALYATVLDAGRVRAHAVAGGLAVPVDAAPPKPLESLALKSSAGLSWELWRGAHGWSLGQISLSGEPLEDPVTYGILALRDVKTGEVRWLPADKAQRIGPSAVLLSGQTKIGDATLQFGAEIALQEKLPAATWTASWSVDKDIAGWEVCLAYHDGFNNAWRVQSYPWAGNSKSVKMAPMRYCGVPGALVYRPDQSVVVLFAIDSNSDYLHPETLDSRCRVAGGSLALDQPQCPQEYRLLILPGMEAISTSNLAKVKSFFDRGGKVIATTRLPDHSAEFGKRDEVRAMIRHIFGAQVTAARDERPRYPKVGASSVWQGGGHDAASAFDGDPETRWNAQDQNGADQWLEVDFGTPRTFEKVAITEVYDRATSHRVEYWDFQQWRTCASGAEIGATRTHTFTPVTASRVRLFIPEVKSDTPSIAEFRVLDAGGTNLAALPSWPGRVFVNRNPGGGAAWFVENPRAAALRQTIDQALPQPDVTWLDAPAVRGGYLSYLHKEVDGRHFWFFANSSDTPVNTRVRLRGVYSLERWNPHTGRIEPCPVTSSAAGTSIQLQLDPVSSVFVVGR